MHVSGSMIVAMPLLRLLTTAGKWLALEVVALIGAVTYVLLSNFLPESGGQVLAGMVLLLLVAVVGYRLFRVLRDPVGAARRPPED